MENIFGINIRKIRKTHGFKQAEIAKELSNFALRKKFVKEEDYFSLRKWGKLERGEQHPNSIDIAIISEFFVISEEDLLKPIGREAIKRMKFSINTKDKKINKYFLLPIFDCKKDSEHSSFKIALNKHVKLSNESEFIFNEEEFKYCANLYLQTWEESGILECLANYLSLQLLKCFQRIGLTYTSKNIKKLISRKNLVGNIELKNAVKKNRQEYISKSEIVEEYISVLRKGGFEEFVEYFTVMSYFVGFVESKNSYITNNAIGWEFVNYFLKLENKYIYYYILCVSYLYEMVEGEELEDLKENLDEYLNNIKEKIDKDVIFLSNLT